MRGSPILRALFAFLCLLALGIPVWKLTAENTSASAGPVSTPVVPAVAQKAAVTVKLSFTAIPSSVKVLHLGEEIWRVSTPAQEVEQQLQLEYPKEGIELQFDVEWADDSLAAMKVALTNPNGVEHERSLWGRGSVSDVLTFP
ncbi:MAG: hypothetical protein EOP84_34450 [Verrucomicrobiaceae bacterium]|nr:MAG: hypothetical protein EOP84_34450 [Verrucomicrobiaceae bacterium]